MTQETTNHLYPLSSTPDNDGGASPTIDDIPVAVTKRRRIDLHLKSRFTAAFCCCFDQTNYEGPDIVYNTRYCGDPWFLVLFILFWIGMFIIAGFGIRYGNPITLIQPTDYQNNVCGYAKDKGNHNKYDLSDRPKLWYPFSIQVTLNDGIKATIADALDLGICVQECPTETFDLDSPNIHAIVCDYEHNNLTMLERVNAATAGNGCFFNHFLTSENFKRCIPVLTNTTASYLNKVVGKTLAITNGFKRSISEVYNSYIPLIISAFVTLVLCILFVILLRLFVGPVIYVVVLLVFVCLGAAGGYASWTAYNKYINSRAEKNGGYVNEEMVRNAKVWAAVGGVIDASCLVYLGAVVFLFRRVRTAIQVIRQASKAVMSNITMVIVPVLAFSVIVVVTIYWIIVGAYLQSCTNNVVISANDTALFNKYAQKIEDLQPFISLNISSNNDTLAFMENGSTLQFLQIYHLFGWLWTVAFIQAIACTIIAGVVATWYFSGADGKRKARKLEVFRWIGRVLFWHLGSLAFGSLFVAIVQLIRYLFNKLKKKLDKSGNGTIRWTTKVITALLWLLEKIVKFVNRNAYIIIAIKGRDFCRSSSQAFNLIVSNIITLGVVNFLSTAILFLGKILITSIGGVVCYMIIDLNFRYGGNLCPGVQYGLAPTIVSVLINYVLASLFMDMYNISIDTILICFCLDAKHGGHDDDGKPQHMSEKEYKAFFRPKSSSDKQQTIKVQPVVVGTNVEEAKES